VVSAIVVETERLLLREWDDERWAAFVAGTNTPAVMRWLGGVFSPEQMVAAFTRFAAPFVLALTVPGNRASQKVMERLGMRRTPYLDFRDRRFAMAGYLNPCIVTLIEREEWRAQRERRA
jgi:RimJ/RimL family protein N-acetyltransferase